MGLRPRLRGCLSKAASTLERFSRRVYLSPEEKRVAQWCAIDGDRTLRLEYDLTEESIVFDVGGYEGRWSSDIFSRYCCRIHIFEPVKRFADQIHARFHKNNRITVHPFGLAAESMDATFAVAGDRSSAHLEGAALETCRLVCAVDFLACSGIAHVDLMKINIEGGEYELLEHLVERKWIANIVNLQVQFHDFVSDADARRQRIREALSQTHSVTYSFDYVWENWRLKSVGSPSISQREDKTP